MNKSNYENLKNNRIIKEEGDSRKFFDINRNDLVMVYLTDEDRFVAEYDIDDIRVSQTGISIKAEPIYNAPETNGLKADDILYYQLSSYSSTAHWKYVMRDPVVKINERDYKILSDKLVHR